MAYVNPITGKIDPFNLSTVENSPLKIEATTENNSAQVVEAQDGSGTVVAHHVYGESMSPSADYSINATGSFPIVLGDISEYKEKKIMLGNVSINTQFGTEPTVSASGEQVEEGAAKSHYFDAGTATVSTSLHAQILFNAFTLPTDGNKNDGCTLTAANYTASADILKATSHGDTVASDVGKGQIEVQITIISVVAGVTPEITPGEGWEIVAPLTCSDAKAAYPTWTATLRKYLTHSEVGA